jgi:serine/threonine protein kinase/class 3 adenylate cyclase
MAELRTFVFTDIVRSVALKREMPGHSDAERDQAFIERVLTPHRERIERELAAYHGRVVSTAGDGHFLVFSDTISAARWAIGVQRSHLDEPIRTSHDNSVSTRISIHLGIPQVDPRDPDNFVGKPIDYASRLSDYATGGQILVSRSVVVVLEDAGMDGVSFYHHGRHELKGIGRVDIFELVYDPDGPRQMLREPRESMSRQWTVLPPTVGLTELGEGNAAGARGARVSAKPQAAEPLKLGNYLLEERVGSGGMGEVYRARHSQFGRMRAVKVIRQHFVETGHEEVIRRFYQEIKAVGALDHPNIVVAIDSSAPTDPIHYLVMEYIDGLPADALVKRLRQLPVAEACEIARQAARGLAYIHQHGMVHRDIKPSNLMLTLVRTDDVSGTKSAPLESGDRQAVVKILDLGLALLVGEDQQRFTRMENRTMGTAMYMSPEQWKTTSVDIRADIYSLGCTLYHLLAGKPPFFESDLKPEKAHEREPLPPIQSVTPIPRALWDVLTRMTAKNPEDRYPDPSAVAAALAPFAEGHRLARFVQVAAETEMLAGRTDGVAKSETRVTPSAQSDTERGRPGSRIRLPKSLPPVARRTVLRTVSALATLIAVGGIGWLAWQATARRQSVQEALEARGEALQVAADFATMEILDEINLRFDILERLAANEELRRHMNQILRDQDNEELWKDLENWLGARKADHDREASADSWFINDVRGIQVARSPHSDASLGANYAERDYFHGLGVDPPEGTDLKPITAPHLSAVYRSTSSGHLKVAFSVPIENGLRGEERGVVGVLAMSVDLGEFDFKWTLPRGQEVVLVDLREAVIDEVKRRGLVLHRKAQEAYERGESPPWISSELLARFDQLVALAPSRAARSTPPLIEYSDEAATGGQPYRAAVKAVVDHRPDEQVIDRGWLVLVQEPLAR